MRPVRHDDLGPVLAGLTRRVQAVLDAHCLTELDVLATDLALCRADCGRTGPAALSGGDLATAIARLVQSFDAGNGGVVRVTLSARSPPGSPR
jgi:hypothetical protein